MYALLNFIDVLQGIEKHQQRRTVGVVGWDLKMMKPKVYPAVAVDTEKPAAISRESAKDVKV